MKKERGEITYPSALRAPPLGKGRTCPEPGQVDCRLHRHAREEWGEGIKKAVRGSRTALLSSRETGEGYFNIASRFLRAQK